MAQEAELLILDEPTSHLDPRYAMLVLEALARLHRERGVAILVSLHDVNLAALFAQRLVVLVGGQVMAEGQPADVLTAETMQQAFGVSVHVQRHPELGVPQVLLSPATA
jgi:iron complex transport system ATP-binding protein